MSTAVFSRWWRWTKTANRWPCPGLHPTTADEKRRWDAALLRKALRKELAQRFEQVRTASMAAMAEAVPCLTCAGALPEAVPAWRAKSGATGAAAMNPMGARLTHLAGGRSGGAMVSGRARLGRCLLRRRCQSLQHIAHHDHAGAGQLFTLYGGVQRAQRSDGMALRGQAGVLDDGHGHAGVQTREQFLLDVRGAADALCKSPA